MAVVAGLRDVLELYSGCVAAGRHVGNIQTLGQCAIVELEAARVVEVVRRDSVSVWYSILHADVKSDGRTSSFSKREARAV